MTNNQDNQNPQNPQLNPFILEDILIAAQELMNILKTKNTIEPSQEVLEDMDKLRKNLETVISKNDMFNKIFDRDVEKLKKDILEDDTMTREKRLIKKGKALEQQATEFKEELEKARQAQMASTEESEKQYASSKRKPRRKDWRRIFRSIGMDRR